MARRWLQTTIWMTGLGLLVSTRSLAGPVELEFAKGVVAFSRGDLERAETHFLAVVEQEPDHGQATYYLGQAALGRGAAQRAVELFGRVTELMPDKSAVRLDLALALIKLGKFGEAQARLLAATDKLEDRASFHYYLGYCRFRMERFREAIEPFGRAQEMDQGFAASAGYYLGLVHFKLGEQEEAARRFKQVTSARTDTRVTAFARENLALLTEERSRPSSRQHGAYASTGMAYDSNVMLNPTDTSKTPSAMAFVSAGGFYSPIQTKQDELRLSANFHRNFHTAKDSQGFDLTDLAVGVLWRHAFLAGHRLELGYQFDLDMLDGGGDAEDILGLSEFGVYMEGHTGQALFRFYQGSITETSVHYRIRKLTFHSAIRERDSLGHEFILRQDILLAKSRLRLAVLAGVAYEDGRAVQWNLWGPFAQLEARFSLFQSLSLWAQLAYRREDHPDSGGHWEDEKRLDNQWLASGGINLSLTPYLSLGLSYRIDRNRSLQAFSYDRHLVSLALFAGI